jgi:hypothetical protein
MTRLTGAKASDGHYILLFEGQHDNCVHAKHIARVLDYTFVFCKDTKEPIAIYCGSEVIDDEDVVTLVGELAEKYSLVGALGKKPYFDELAKSLLSVEDVRMVTG